MKNSKKTFLKIVLNFSITSRIIDYWRLEQNQLRVENFCKSGKKKFLKIGKKNDFFSFF